MSSAILLGYLPMDDIHAEFEEMLGHVLECAENELDDWLTRIMIHLQEHFEAEEQWMRDSGYPNGGCHSDEHDAVLKSAREVAALTDPITRARISRAFFAELASWFPAHARHLDSALSHWMCNKQFGGKPVVLQRISTFSQQGTTI